MDRESAEASELSVAELTRHAWFDRDMSWLEFNGRVLQEALDERNRLLERVKFLAIFSSNLDEFFMKRVAVLRGPADDGRIAAEDRRDRLLPKRAKIISMLEQQASCFLDTLLPRLAEHGVRLVDWEDLSEAQRDEGSRVFETEISPVLTPLSLDAAHPFPYVSNLSTSWAFRLVDPPSGTAVLARVKVPRELPQWIRVRAGVPAGERVFIGLDQLIVANAPKLFPGMGIESATLIRVCRDAEVELDDDGVDKRALVERELRQRRFEPVVRLEVQPEADPLIVAE